MYCRDEEVKATTVDVRFRDIKLAKSREIKKRVPKSKDSVQRDLGSGFFYISPSEAIVKYVPSGGFFHLGQRRADGPSQTSTGFCEFRWISQRFSVVLQYCSRHHPALIVLFEQMLM